MIEKTSSRKDVQLTDFGAKPDMPEAPCHDAINLAIVTCNQAGGGTVIVPKGTFYTGPITLKSNVNFHLEEGARVEVRYQSRTVYAGCPYPLGRSRLL